MAVEFTPSPELYPFRSRWTDIQGARVHYIDEGVGPVILMAHGQPTWSFLYRKLILRLRGQYRCIAMDLPGFGLSDRPPGYLYTPEAHAKVLAEFVEQLDLSDILLMCQDWGGPTSLAALSTMPERVRGLVAMNTWYWPATGLKERAMSAAMSLPPLRTLSARANLFVRVAMRALTSTALTRQEAAHYLKVQPAGARQGVLAFPAQIRLARSWFEELHRRVPSAFAGVPILLVWGRKDPLLGSSEVIRRWLQDFPEAKLVELPEANHFLQEDAPEEIVEALLEWDRHHGG